MLNFQHFIVLLLAWEKRIPSSDKQDGLLLTFRGAGEFYLIQITTRNVQTFSKWIKIMENELAISDNLNPLAKRDIQRNAYFAHPD